MRMRMITMMVILVLTQVLCAQNQILPNKFILDAFTQKQVAQMSEQKIEYLNYVSEKAWEIIDVPKGKDANTGIFPFLYRVDNETKQTLDSFLECNGIIGFNLLEFRYSVKKERSYYLIAGCNKFLVIKSADEITKGFNSSRNK